MFGEGSSSGPYVCYGLPPDEQLQPSAENFSSNAGKTAWPCADFNYVSGTNMSSHGNENSFSTSGYSQSFKTKPSTSPRRKPQHKVNKLTKPSLTKPLNRKFIFANIFRALLAVQSEATFSNQISNLLCLEFGKVIFITRYTVY